MIDFNDPQIRYLIDYVNLKQNMIKYQTNFLNQNQFIRKVFRRISFIKNNINEPYCSYEPFLFQPFHEAAGIDYLAKCFKKESISDTNNAFGVINK